MTKLPHKLNGILYQDERDGRTADGIYSDEPARTRRGLLLVEISLACAAAPPSPLKRAVLSTAALETDHHGGAEVCVV